MGVDRTAVYMLREVNNEVTIDFLCRIQPSGAVLTTHPAAIAFDGQGRLLATGVEKVVEVWFIDERAYVLTSR